MTRDDDKREFDEDRRWIEVARDVFRPEPMDALRFERRLFARPEARVPVRWLAAPLVAAAIGALAHFSRSSREPARQPLETGSKPAQRSPRPRA